MLVSIVKKVTDYIRYRITVKNWNKKGNPIPAPDVIKQRTLKEYAKIFSVLVGILMIVLDKSAKTVLWSLIYTSVHSLIMMGVIIVIAINDFTSAFIKFHEMFFSNDLWLLNPMTDRLIQMLPEGFFLDMALSIGITHLSITCTLGIIALYNLRRI